MDRVYYFAYSHLIDSDQMRALGVRYYEDTWCELAGYQLEFNVLYDEHFRFETQGMANIVPRNGSSVEGVLYELDEIDVDVLDHEAGVHLMKYYRKSVDVQTSTGMKRAITYAAWPDMTSEGLYPHEKCIHQMLHAAQQAGISSSYQHWLSSQLVSFNS